MIVAVLWNVGLMGLLFFLSGFKKVLNVDLGMYPYGILKFCCFFVQESLNLIRRILKIFWVWKQVSLVIFVLP